MTPFFSSFFGACVGSFLNVCLIRWKNGENFFYPPSHCLSCKSRILWYDNIPILSYILLKAKCRFCHKPIAWQYPLVELLTAWLFYFSFLIFSNELHLLISSFFFVSFIILLVASDLKWRLLPHPFNDGFMLLGLILSNQVFSLLDLFTNVCGFILVFCFLYGMVQIYPNSLGGGDIKMISCLSIWLGFPGLFYSLLLAFGTGSLVVIVLLLQKKITKKELIPFGPFLALGALLVWFFPERINHLGIGL